MTKLVEITLDFETYYSTKEKYSLRSKGMNPEKYIRNPKFEVIGLAVKVNSKPAEWLAPHEIQDWIDHIEVAYGWDNVRVIAHNAKFDAAILGWIYGVYPRQIADTLGMSRAIQQWDSHSLDNLTKQLREKHNWFMWYSGNHAQCGVFEYPEQYQYEDKGDEVVAADGKHLMDFTDEEYDKYGGYATKDVDLTWSAYRWFIDIRKFPEEEIEVMTLTIEMFTYPVLELHRPVLEEVKKMVNGERQALLDRVGCTVEQLRSDDTFAGLLRELGVEPPTKLNAKGQTKYAFAKKDLGFLALLEHEDQAVVDLVQARLGNKSSQAVTRVESLLELSERGLMPAPLEYYAAHTGRWGGGGKDDEGKAEGGGINLQNLNRNKLVDKSTPVGTKVFYNDRADVVVSVLDDGRVQLARAGVVENDEELLHIMGLRDALKAPKGKKLVVFDLSQVELRANAWEWGEQWVLDTLVAGKDIYKVTAAQTYGIDYDEVNKSQRFVGKSQQLGLGYGAGVNGLKVVMGKRSEEFTDEQLQSFVNAYRSAASNIKRGWDKCKAALSAMAAGVQIEFCRNNLLYTIGDRIALPNGLHLTYRGIHKRQNENGMAEFWFWGRNKVTKKPDWERTFGGKIDENCIAEDTEVLTDRGWVKIQDVKTTDKVFDGLEFVTHGGIIFKSEQSCVNIDGVFMTEDHEVLTNDGWKQARVLLSERSTSSIQRLDRATLRELGCVGESASEETMALAFPMRLWEQLRKRSERREEITETRQHTKLRLPFAQTGKREEPYTRYGEAPAICSMAVNETTMYATEPQSVAQLWWTWDKSMPTLVGLFREFSGRYVSNLQRWVRPRSDRQQRKLRANELPLGYKKTELEQQTKNSVHRYDGRNENGCFGFLRKVWNKANNGILSLIKGRNNATTGGETKLRKKVYDILNCGKRHRFVVKGTGDPFIVHNCTQALCRIIMSDIMIDIRNDFKDRGWTKDDAHICLTVHDEIITCCKEEIAEDVAEIMEYRMKQGRDWYSDLPLDCAGDIAQRYGCAK